MISNFRLANGLPNLTSSGNGFIVKRQIVFFNSVVTDGFHMYEAPMLPATIHYISHLVAMYHVLLTLTTLQCPSYQNMWFGLKDLSPSLTILLWVTPSLLAHTPFGFLLIATL